MQAAVAGACSAGPDGAPRLGSHGTSSTGLTAQPPRPPPRPPLCGLVRGLVQPHAGAGDIHAVFGMAYVGLAPCRAREDLDEGQEHGFGPLL